MPIIDNGGCCGVTTITKTQDNVLHFSSVPAPKPAQPAFSSHAVPASGGVLLASAAVIALLTS